MYGHRAATRPPGRPSLKGSLFGGRLKWSAPVVLAGAISAVAGSACANFDKPPARYHCHASVALLTVDPSEIARYCHSWDAQGCYNPAANTVVIMDPFDRDSGYVGRMIQHELGHACGWPGDHPSR
jgi:hypothetical protein